jgi:hypothetical protein
VGAGVGSTRGDADGADDGAGGASIVVSSVGEGGVRGTFDGAEEHAGSRMTSEANKAAAARFLRLNALWIAIMLAI